MIPVATQPTTMRDLLPRLQAVLTASLLTGRDARLRCRAMSGLGSMMARHAVVDMPFSAAEVEMLVEAVGRCAGLDEAAEREAMMTGDYVEVAQRWRPPGAQA